MRTSATTFPSSPQALDVLSDTLQRCMVDIWIDAPRRSSWHPQPNDSRSNTTTISTTVYGGYLDRCSEQVKLWQPQPTDSRPKTTISTTVYGGHLGRCSEQVKVWQPQPTDARPNTTTISTTVWWTSGSMQREGQVVAATTDRLAAENNKHVGYGYHCIFNCESLLGKGLNCRGFS